MSEYLGQTPATLTGQARTLFGLFRSTGLSEAQALRSAVDDAARLEEAQRTSDEPISEAMDQVARERDRQEIASRKTDEAFEPVSDALNWKGI